MKFREQAPIVQLANILMAFFHSEFRLQKHSAWHVPHRAYYDIFLLGFVYFVYKALSQRASMGIIFGLATALGWGIADFLVRFSARSIGSFRTLFFMQFIGLFTLGIYLLATGELITLLHHTSWQPWAWAVLAISLNILSALALYRAYEIGVLMIVSPITSCYAAVTSALAFFTGEKVGQLHIVGMVVTLIGAALVATPLVNSPVYQNTLLTGHKGLPPGVIWAVLASVGYGVAFWLLGFHVSHDLGAITTTWLTRLLTPCALAISAPLAGLSLKLPTGNVWWYIGAIGITDTFAFVTYNTGLTVGQVSIVSVISSLYSAVTVILAWIVLRERLQPSQWLGVGVVFAGIILVNI
jgi:drug/metabolite transporter (DMT)-like permease